MKQYDAAYYHKRLHLLQDVSILLIQGMAWLGVYFFLEMYVNQNCQIWFGVFWLSVIYAITLLMRHFCHSLSVLLIGHGVLFGIVILFAYETRYLKEARTIFCLLVLAGCLIETVKQWHRGFAPFVYDIKWYFFIEVLILYFYGSYSRETAYQAAAFLLAVLFLLGHFWCVYLQGMNDYLDQYRELEGVPRSSILRLNTKVVFILLAVLLALLSLVSAGTFDSGFSLFGQYLARFFRMLILGLQSAVRAVRSWNHPEEAEPPEQAEILQMPQAAAEGGGNSVYALLGVIISLLAFFYLVYRLARAFDKRDDRTWRRPDFGGHLRMDDQVEELEAQERKRFHLFRTNREKIRYRFKKRVKKSLKGVIPKASTAWDLHEAVQRQDPDKGMYSLTALYHVARYGRREITSAEMKSLNTRQ